MRLVNRVIIATLLAFLGLAAGPTWAQEMDDETPAPAGGGDDEAGAPAALEPAAEEAEPVLLLGPNAVRWGAGVRLRWVFMPTAVMNLFLDHSTPMSSVGFGAQAIRRKGNFDIAFGLEYENVSPSNGYYVESGGNPALPEDNDFVTFDGLAVLGLDASFIWHAPIAKRVDFRYGAGIGIGFVFGDIYQADASCTGPDLSAGSPTCTHVMGLGPKSNDVPPVVPIVNVLLGTRIKVNDQINVNVEGGFRDVFYLGVGSDYIF